MDKAARTMKEEADKMNNVKEITYPCLMQSILNKHVVRFDNPLSGEVVKDGEATCVSKGFYSNMWIACTNKNTWQPYVEEDTLQESPAPEWPKILQTINGLEVWQFSDKNNAICLFMDKSFNSTLKAGDKYSFGCTHALDNVSWKPYTGTEFKLPVETTQTPSAELLASSEPMTAQDIVKRLEELKMGMNNVNKDISLLQVELNNIHIEYADLKDQLLTLI